MKHIVKLTNILAICAAFCLAFARTADADETNPPSLDAGIKAESPIPPVSSPPAPTSVFRHLIETVAQELVPLAFFGMIVTIVGLGLFAAHRKNRMLHETIRAMVEKGQPIPPELLNPDKRSHKAGNDMGRGLTLVGLGLGLMIFLYVQNNHNWAVGMIPMLMGIAFLIAWKFRTKQSGQN